MKLEEEKTRLERAEMEEIRENMWNKWRGKREFMLQKEKIPEDLGKLEEKIGRFERKVKEYSERVEDEKCQG